MSNSIDTFFSANPFFVIPRKRDEEFPVSEYRNEFIRDRDRILYCKSFRRMSGKTQIFLPSSDDHFRTRLTHTVEVMQIAKHIGANLGLNVDLIEAIALGHDIGHTPFGHVGERTLNLLMNGCDIVADFQNNFSGEDMGFKHNWQGVRALSSLLRIYGQPGLNLTAYTLWGIYRHTKSYYDKCDYYKDGFCYLKRQKVECKKKGYYSVNFYKYLKPLFKTNFNMPAWSFEAFVVEKSDEIAQRHHDIEDGLVSGLISKEEIIEDLPGMLENIPDFLQNSQKAELDQLLNRISDPKNSESGVVSYLSKFIISAYCSILIETSKEQLTRLRKQYSINSKQDFHKVYPSLLVKDMKTFIDYPKNFEEFDKKLSKLLTNNVVKSHKAQEMDGKGRYIIRNLVKAYLSNPRQLQDNTVYQVFELYDPDMTKDISYDDSYEINLLRGQIDKADFRSSQRFQIALLRVICDHIAGMTDNYAISQNRHLYG
jgi:dGTPase